MIHLTELPRRPNNSAKRALKNGARLMSDDSKQPDDDRKGELITKEESEKINHTIQRLEAILQNVYDYMAKSIGMLGVILAVIILGLLIS